MEHEFPVTGAQFGYLIKPILPGELAQKRRQNGVVSHQYIEPVQIAAGPEGLGVVRGQLIQIFWLNDSFHAEEISNRAP
jgi:hypothetical protein